MTYKKIVLIIITILILIVAVNLKNKIDELEIIISTIPTTSTPNPTTPALTSKLTPTPTEKIKPQPIPNCIGGLCKANLSVILVKNLITTDRCFNNTTSHASLNDSEIADMKYVISALVSEVYNSTDGRFVLNPIYYEIPEVKVNICKDFWMPPWDIYPYIKDKITKNIDFVIVYFDNVDDETNSYKFVNSFGAGTFGPMDFGIGGASYTSLGLRKEVPNKELIQGSFHEWLHQLKLSMNLVSKAEDKYSRVLENRYLSAPEYPPCGKAVNDTYQWFPSADDGLIDPDFKYCGQITHLNFSQLMEWNRHVLSSAHFDANKSLIFNRCRDGIQNGPETDVDTDGFGTAACYSD